MPLAKLIYQSIIWKGLFFLSAFILNVTIARHYQASVSGEIFYLINLYALIILIAGLSIESSIGYYISREEISITSLINFSWIWTIFIAVIIFFFTTSKFSTNSYFILTTITFISGNVLSGYCTAIFYAKRNFFVPNIINTIINLSLILLLVASFFKIKIISNEVFLLIFFSSSLFQGLVGFVTLKIIYLPVWRFTFPENAELKKLFRFALISLSANLISFLLYRVDYWFVKKYCTAYDLGNYIQVSKIAQVFFILPGILAGTVFPLIASGKQQNVNNILATLSRVIFTLYLLCCLILAITGYWLFPFLFGSTFNHMYITFLYLIPGILALSTLYTLTAYYAGKNRIIVNIKGALIALIFIIIADLYFIPRYGINAAAMISSIGYIIYHIYVLTIFTREYKSTPISFFNFKFSDITKVKNSFFNKSV